MFREASALPSYSADRRAALARGLKAARRQAGLTAGDAAAKLTDAGLHCKRGTLLAWERGIGSTSREPFASDLCIIARVYGCEVYWLFHGWREAASEAESE